MFQEVINKLYRRQDLTVAEAEATMSEVMEGRATPAQIAGVLVGLAMKGERPSEIVGLARTMRAHAVKTSRLFDDTFDTCGTGGDGSHTFNVSSLAAIVLAACGVRVAKHGNRSVSSKCGSADLFEALGVAVTASPNVVEHCLQEVGIAFFFAPTFHPSMRHAAPTRRELGVRTAFNLLGPLTNPAGSRRQVVGVPRPDLTDLIARVLGLLGSECAWVVHGADGLDEISTTGPTKVSEVRGNTLTTFYLHPSEFGLRASELTSLQVEGLDDSVEIAHEVLNGHPGPAREFVLANTAAGLVVAGRVPSLRSGMEQAAEAIDSGRASVVLQRMVANSQG